MRKRALVCFFMCIVLFFISVMRVATVSTTDYTAVYETKNGVRLKVGDSRGTIFDCNGARLTNQEEKIIACITPTPRAVTAISQELEGTALENVLERLKSGKPVACEVSEMIECDGIICTKVFTDDNTPSRHIIGYTDSDEKGVSGIEKAYDSILYCEEDITVFYNTDAKGRILEGVEPELTNPNHALTHSVTSTIDINIQEIAEKYAESLEKGAVIVADAKTNKIRASVSRPYFDRANVSIYLESENSPLLNRAINAYNVGSVFKPCVAAAAIENDNKNFLYTCTGSCEIIDRYFKCHKLDGHGLLDLKGGIAYSCNTFFYNLAFNVGGEKIYNYAKKLSFGQSLKICEGIKTAEGNLPQKESLENIAHLANFSIGQGELLLSPISILTLYSAIASNGEYYIPSIIEETSVNGNKEKYDIGAPTHALKKETAELLKEYLKSVLEEGTGENAKPKTVSAAGKTATAQTGKYRYGIEISESWFCGFFPADEPEYIVIVFSEDDQRQDLTCSEIFRNIADSITALKY